MKDKIVGREDEMNRLAQYVRSDRAEFIAVYGRRRVGKTFLIRYYFDNQFDFDMTGIIEGSKKEQMMAFYDALKQKGYEGKAPRNWLDAFFALRDLLEKNMDPEKPCLIFIDELPCLDTPKSGFIHALGHFWNSWAAWKNNIKLIICGSATSWMVRNIINNHGGLHDRVTHEMNIKPFTLRETEEFFHAYGFPWSRLSVLHTYMAVGGIPYYLSLFRQNESPAQGIDRLFFSEYGELRKEYQRLFHSLFRNPEPYLAIIKLLASKPSGLTMKEISRELKISSNGYLRDVLTNLVYCDFLKEFRVRTKRIKVNSVIYKLVDFYTLFYHAFVQSAAKPKEWAAIQDTPTVNTWLGLSYERVCLAHIPQIKAKIGISGVATETYSWRGTETESQVQVDLIIERSDKMINLCEIKYSKAEYSLTKEEYLKIGRRVELFKEATATRYSIVPTMITTFGLAQGMYAETIPVTVVLDDLFVSI